MRNGVILQGEYATSIHNLLFMNNDQEQARRPNQGQMRWVKCT